MILPVVSIARNTFRECLRQPIFLILELTSLSIIGCYPAFSLFVFREQEKLVTDGALATLLLFGWITAVLSASHAITREIESGTVSVILAKPVSRAAFVAGKLLGILAVLTLHIWVNGIAAVLALRIAKDQFEIDYVIFWMLFGSMGLACVYGALRNYFRRSSFAAGAAGGLAWLLSAVAAVVYVLPARDRGSYDWSQHLGYSSNLIVAIMLVGFAVWALGALAVALSAQLSLVSNMTVCAVIFVLGLMSDYLYLQLSELGRGDFAQLLHFWPYALVPFVALSWALACRHFPQRRRPGWRLWMIHLVFGAATAVLLARGVSTVLARRYLDAPTPLMRVVTGLCYPVKQASAEAVHALIPNWQLFWLADALAAGQTIPGAYVFFGACYITCFVLLFALIGFALFSWREVGRQLPG